MILAASRTPPEDLRQHSPGENPQGLAFAASLKGEEARGSKAVAVKEENAALRRPGQAGANAVTRGRYRKRAIMSAFSIMGEADMEGWELPVAVAAAVKGPRLKRRRMLGRAPAKRVEPPSSSSPPSDADDDTEIRKRGVSPAKKSTLLEVDALAPSTVNSRAGIFYPCKDVTVCSKAALFGIPFQTPSSCPLHKSSGMKLLMTCQEFGCRARAVFGHIRGRPSKFCRRHRGVDMLDVSRPTCSAADCEKIPAFGFAADPKPTRCSLHRSRGMRNLTLPACLSCGKTAYYGSADLTLKRTHCGVCRTPEMIRKPK